MTNENLSIVDALLRRDLLEGRKHHPLEKQRLEMAKRLRLTPVARGISTEVELALAKREFGILETFFTQWRRDLVSASNTSETRSPVDGLNDGMRSARTSFAEQGGLSAVHSEQQMDFALSHGMLMKIALEIRDGLQVTVGGVLMLSRGSNYRSDEAEQRDFDQQRLFPLYDMEETLMSSGSAPDHANTSITLRSVLLPTIADAIGLGLSDGNDISEEFRTHALRHLGLPAAAKGALIEMINVLKEQKIAHTTTLRSHIGEIGPQGRADQKISNEQGRGFNDWMKTVGSVFDSFELDTPSRLRLFFRVLMADIDDAKKALLGADGIASGKGHSAEAIQALGQKTAQRLQKAIADGQHAPW